MTHTLTQAVTLLKEGSAQIHIDVDERTVDDFIFNSGIPLSKLYLNMKYLVSDGQTLYARTNKVNDLEIINLSEIQF